MTATTGPAGNVYNKYETRNPIARRLVRGFLDAFDALLDQAELDRVHEIGCGEGYLAARMRGRGMTVRASDPSPEIVAQAQAAFGPLGIDFVTRSVYDLDPTTDSAPLIVCCEVLEHLAEPDQALERIAAVTGQACLLSVPREPLWRILNMARGRYWADFGNTPGHLQHWSGARFLDLVGRHFHVAAVRRPLPWTMVLCRRR